MKHPSSTPHRSRHFIHYFSVIAVVSLFLLFFYSPFTVAQDSPPPQISLVGIMSDKAIISINGAAPQTVSIGQNYRGIKLLSIQRQTASLLITSRAGNTQRITLTVGHSPMKIGFDDASASSQGRGNIMPPACSPDQINLFNPKVGTFETPGYINGRPVNFLVDTGASVVSMTERQARILGINNYASEGREVSFQTANGTHIGYVLEVKSVRVGNIEIKNVAISVGGDMEGILLGNSFLRHLDIEMTTNRMTLKRRCP